MSRANFLILALPRSSNRPERKIGRRPIRNNGIWKRKGVRVLPSATTFSSPALEPWNAPWFHSFLLSSDEIVESLETRIALDHRGEKRPRFVGSLSTCRHCVTLYRVNLEGFSLRSNRGLFLVCLFVCSLTYFLWFFFPFLWNFGPILDATGRKEKTREKERERKSFIKSSAGWFKKFGIKSVLNVGSGFQPAIFTLYYLEKKGRRDLKYSSVTKDCVSYGKFILRSRFREGGKRKELIIPYVSCEGK